MKKWIWIILALLLAVSFAACKKPADADGLPAIGTDVDSPAFSAETWPTEFDAWQVPTLQAGTVVYGTNLGGSDGTITQGSSATTVLNGVKQSDIDAYDEELAKSGFVAVSDSADSGTKTYEKSTGDEKVTVTVTFSEDGTAEIKTENSTVAAAATTLQWPEKVNAVPAFNKGIFKETSVLSESPSAIYLIAFKEVSAADVASYADGLTAAGFTFDAEMGKYEKTVGSVLYTVSPIEFDGLLQLLIAADPV